MRGFLYFVGRAFGAAVARTIMLAIFLAFGLTPEAAWQSLIEPPWWVVHKGVQSASLLIAVVIMAWILYDQSRVEAAVPDRLKRRTDISFGEIADALADVPSLGLSREEAMHALLKALWRGDFESRSGNSRTWLPDASGMRLIGSDWVPISGRTTTPTGEHLAVDSGYGPEPLRFSRRNLLRGWDLGISDIYPGLAITMPFIRDDSRRWESVKKRINFPLLERILPRQYDETARTAYLERLRISRSDMLRWFRRLRAGRYNM